MLIGAVEDGVRLTVTTMWVCCGVGGWRLNVPIRFQVFTAFFFLKMKSQAASRNVRQWIFHVDLGEGRNGGEVSPCFVFLLRGYNDVAC